MKITLEEPTVKDVEPLYMLIVENRQHLTALPWARTATMRTTYDFLSHLPASEKFRLIYVDDKLAGSITIRPIKELADAVDIGYWISKEFRNQGVMTRAVQLMTFDQRKHIYAEVMTNNPASRKVLINNGFVPVGTKIGWEVLVKQPQKPCLHN